MTRKIDWERFNNFYDSHMTPLESVLYDIKGFNTYLLVGRLWDIHKSKLDQGLYTQDEFEAEWKKVKSVFEESMKNGK